MNSPLVARYVVLAALGIVPALQAQTNSPSSTPNVIRVPMHPVEGFGPFEAGFVLDAPSDTSGSNPWHNTWARVRNIPSDLRDVRVGRIEMQLAQKVYHAMHAGLLTKEFALLWIRMAHADTSRLTAHFVDEEVSFVVGLDSLGRRVMIFDADHDHDFLGEKRVVLSGPDDQGHMHGTADTAGYLEPQEVAFEFWDGEQIRQGRTKIALRRPELIPAVVNQWTKGAFALGWATYGHTEGRLRIGTTDIDCYLNNGFRGGVFDDRNSNVILSEAGEMRDRLNPKNESLRADDVVTLGNARYAIGPISIDGREITLRRVRAGAPAEGLTAGLFAKDFSRATTRSDSIHLRTLRGTFTLLDFWGSWCVGCRFDVPYLRDAYHVLAARNLNVIGIAFDDSTYLERFMKEYGVAWPQILVSGPEDTLLNAYGVREFPTMFLVDTSGRILSRNVGRGEQLAPELFRVVGGEKEFRDYVLSGNVEFDYRDGSVRRVEVAGNFSNWTPVPLYNYDGAFRRRIELKPGSYQYKFLVDNAWTLDPSNDSTITNADHHVNNVLLIR